MNFYGKVLKFELFLAAVGSGLCLMAIMLMTVVTVFGRYVVHIDLIPGGYNIIESILFPLLVFWGLPLAHRQGAFPKLDILAEKGPLIVRKFSSVIVLAVELLMYSIVLWYVAKFAISAIEIGRQLQIGTRLWPAWPVLIMVPLSFLLLVLEIIRLLISDLSSLFGREKW